MNSNDNNEETKEILHLVSRAISRASFKSFASGEKKHSYIVLLSLILESLVISLLSHSLRYLST